MADSSHPHSSAATEREPTAILVEWTFKKTDPNALNGGGGSCVHWGANKEDYKAHIQRLKNLDFVDTINVTNLYPDQPQEAPVLDWLATKTNYELSFDGWNEDSTWNVHSVNGGRNDREWTLLATGGTPEEALRKAMSLSLSRPMSKCGGSDQ